MAIRFAVSDRNDYVPKLSARFACMDRTSSKEWVGNNFLKWTLISARSGIAGVPTQSVGTRMFGLGVKSGS